jgi:teichuronic acid biosynthesis glycosyltransferase TuaC
MDSRFPQSKINVLALGTIFPNNVQPNLGVFSGLALTSLSQLAGVRVVAPVPWFPGLGVVSGRERRLWAIPRTSRYQNLEVTHPRQFRTPGFMRHLHPVCMLRPCGGTSTS